jgi:hypothetical protein
MTVGILWIAVQNSCSQKNLAPQLTLLTGLPHCWQLCSNNLIDARVPRDIIKPTNTVKDIGAIHVLAVHT